MSLRSATLRGPNVQSSALDAVRARAINRPRFRGRLHSWCFVLSIPAGVLLVVTAPTGAAALGAFAFAFGISAMFGISSLFHRTDFDDHGIVGDQRR